MDCLLEELFVCLQQVIDGLSTLSKESYTTPSASAGQRTLGHQVCEVTDRFKALMLGIGDGLIQYEVEESDAEVLADPKYAAAVLRGIIMGLEQFDEAVLEQSLYLKMTRTAQEQQSTTVRRELEYLLELALRELGAVRSRGLSAR